MDLLCLIPVYSHLHRIWIGSKYPTAFRPKSLIVCLSFNSPPQLDSLRRFASMPADFMLKTRLKSSQPLPLIYKRKLRVRASLDMFEIYYFTIWLAMKANLMVSMFELPWVKLTSFGVHSRSVNFRLLVPFSLCFFG